MQIILQKKALATQEKFGETLAREHATHIATCMNTLLHDHDRDYRDYLRTLNAASAPVLTLLSDLITDMLSFDHA